MDEVCAKAKRGGALFFFLPPPPARAAPHSLSSFLFVVILLHSRTTYALHTSIADPTREWCPDYALPQFDDERLVFTVDGKTNEKAVEILRALWTIHHARDIERWENQQEAREEEERQRREQAVQAAEQQ